METINELKAFAAKSQKENWTYITLEIDGMVSNRWRVVIAPNGKKLLKMEVENARDCQLLLRCWNKLRQFKDKDNVISIGSDVGKHLDLC